MEHALLNPQAGTETIGFFQVIDKNGSIKAQRVGTQTQEQLDFVKNHWFNTKDEQSIIFTEHSDYIEPFGFFTPCLKGTTVTVYNDLVSKEDHISGDLTDYEYPDFKVKTLTVDEFDKEIYDFKKWQTWVCFVGNEWVGTSEY
tara:strand:+ start:213 stop:641 length:429 start_codon:yes stop_codon:yes gene_type:complete